ncbi:hypothetical protein Lfu02_57980 [Longispora fulva]|uniref:Uncharacterized protein n=1 Tax=Longispora fulva TaxID=619741 RepID=A0A8J7KGD1_9ACTN|nr:hypothetical protein [Longispora fulva]MBG6137220.1 hypothetical protein [Longispora fulva]GIG61426.1 hypothetical protein Lfu02_57980 [Longispora fulva]
MYKKLAIIGGTALVVLGGAALPAVAGPGAGDKPITLDAKGCKLAQDLRPVLDDRLAIINGDANQRGSVTWIKAEAAKARAAGNTKKADKLDKAATKRTEAATKIETRKTKVDKAVTWCTDHGFAAK